jgi:alkylation response protein AidB-like acyl-CoA dehydrogenase
MQIPHDVPQAFEHSSQGYETHLAAMYPREELDDALREIARRLFEHAVMCRLSDEEAFVVAANVMRERFGVEPDREFQQVQFALCDAYAALKYALHGPERAAGEDFRLRFYVA